MTILATVTAWAAFGGMLGAHVATILEIAEPLGVAYGTLAGATVGALISAKEDPDEVRAFLNA